MYTKSNDFQFEVLVNGKSVEEYFHENETFIEGKKGTEFSLKMRNNTGNRVLFVPTIDGLSVMDGKEASFDSRGYIVDSYSSTIIDGWRTSDDQVAKFFFAAIENSYAKKNGNGDNVGVIGCAVFKEKEKPIVITVTEIQKQYIPYPVYPKPWAPWEPWNGPHYGFSVGSNLQNQSLSTGAGSATSNLAYNSLNVSSASNQINCMSAQAQESGNIGTGFGESKYSPVVTVSFDRAEKPAVIFTIRYNTRENLKSMGVQFKKPLYVTPSAFPKEDGYCKPPQN